MVDCPLGPLKQRNRAFQCGCDPNEVENNKAYYYSYRRTHHCCSCKEPQRPEELKELEQTLTCKACYTNFYQVLEYDDPRNQYYYTHGEG